MVAEREKGKDFSGIYNYLKNAGTFEYVNNGNLNVGDELKFMIDPEFENKVANQPWHTQPTIFIVDGKTNQIVGSLDESEYRLASRSLGKTLYLSESPFSCQLSAFPRT